MESPADTLKIVLVSYLNTYPIVWGLKKLYKKYDKLDIKLCPPSQCSRALLEDDEIDAALVPSITYLNSDFPFEILPFGIIANKEVDTVLLAGNSPLEEWKTVLLDNDSLTSVQLTKILFRLKNLTPQFKSGIKEIESLDDKSGALIIGNKCFRLASRFTCIYDLSKLWFELTKLPFVFALFLAKPATSKKKLLSCYLMIKEAIHCGLENLDEVIETWMKENHHEEKLKDRSYYYDYLKNKISYDLTPKTILGLEQFYNYCEKGLPPDKANRLKPDYFSQFALHNESPFE
ncbi:MAG: menaquinone biosynthesis protein [Proteobacteria bacterium]|nr:menaquinone biosynthesis protein [Pseudomonadota bacterium]